MNVRHLLATALIAALAAAPPAHAALVNDYSMTDDVWNTPVATGHFLIDMRALYTNSSPGFLQAPTLSLAYGAAPNLEIGIWSAYTFTGIGSAGSTSGFALINPYLKYQFPTADGAVGFGIVAGAQIPTQGGMEHNVAVEGIAIIPLSSAWSLDINAGIGRQFVTPATLGHLATAFYYTFPSKLTLMGEANALLSSAATPVFGQHVGLLIPLSATWTTDISISVYEQSGASTLVTPQMGFTVTL